MTVVLAIRCADGVVLGADSQITESDRGLSYPAQKLHPLGDYGAWGGSGSRSVLLELEEVFSREAGSILESDDVARELQRHTIPVMRYHYENYIEEVPGTDGAGGPSAYVLAAGYSDDKPFIVELNPHGMIGRYEDIGFHAIGSGAPMAQQAGSLLATFRMLKRPVRYGEAALMRVLDALSFTSPSVGLPFSMARLTQDGAHHLDDDEIEQAREHGRRWVELEQEALDRLF